MEASAVLASAEERVVDEAVAVLAQRDQAYHHSSTAQECRRDMRQLFDLILCCVRKGRTEPIIMPSERIAAHCFAAGTDLTELQGSFDVLAEVLWPHLAGALAGEERLAALRLVNAIVGAGKDAQARTYVALAGRGGRRPGWQPAVPGECSSRVTASRSRSPIASGYSRRCIRRSFIRSSRPRR